jgi:hypothetical protein
MAGWESAVRVEQSVTVGLDSDSAWSLLRSPGAWTLRPRGSMLIDPAAVAGSPGPGRGPMRLLFTAEYGRPYALMLAVTGEVPGQTIALQAAGGRIGWSLSARPARRGAVLEIAAAATVERPARIHAEADLRADVRAWLAALRAAADGRRPWPGERMPDALRQACLADPPAGPAIEATASAVTGVPPDVVAQLFLTAEFGRLMLPAGVAYAGPVPGTPAPGQVGSMRYIVLPRGDGLLTGRVSLLAGASPAGSIRRTVTPPLDETTYRYEPAGTGTRVELAWRCPAQPAGGADAHRDRHADRAAAAVARIRDVIDRLAGG